MHESLTVSPTADPLRVRAADGSTLSVPGGWALLPPGDAGLTRRVKALGPSWTVTEKRGRKVFSRGVWAPASHIESARAEVSVERADPAYARRRAGDAARRERKQAAYEVEFETACRALLRFSKTFAAQELALARAVTRLAAPVGSGTVARTERIPIERRADAAVIAWMRHQTTDYDSFDVPRVKGVRREVRRLLAETSRALLDVHRRPAPHAVASCPLCLALSNPATAERVTPLDDDDEDD
ncbi:MAG: DUF2293 domain-containing protein [Polyangiaceae bacterium]|nr:DUF2293 domain-containing protein [Polyangiaceae bacterium]